MASTSLWLQKAFHAVWILSLVAVTINIIIGAQHLHERLGKPKDDPVISRLLHGWVSYFTMWNFGVHNLYFTLCCMEDLNEFFTSSLLLSPGMQDKLHITRRTILPVILFPCSCMVTSNYWAIYLYSPPMIFGDLKGALPSWVNHVIHTFVGPITVLELYLRAQTEGIWNGGLLHDGMKLGIFFALYMIAVLERYLRNGWWPYPMMDKMNALELLISFSFSYAIGFFWFSVGRYLSEKMCESAGTERLNDGQVKIE